MPELIEVEAYRRLADSAVGRTIVDAPVLDPLGLRGADPDAVRDELVGRTVTGTRRLGKLLLLDTSDGPVGLRFGMTGRLLLDDRAAIDSLLYGPIGDDPAADRCVLAFADGGTMRLRDPRRLGGLELDPDLGRLGPDAATISADELAGALGVSRAPLKARLLDQARIAGLGNLLVDETLHRAGLDPRQAAGDLARTTVEALAGAIRATVAELTQRGGSHTGDLQPHRQPGATCPVDGTPLRRERIGGRTTYWCPAHQRAGAEVRWAPR